MEEMEGCEEVKNGKDEREGKCIHKHDLYLVRISQEYIWKNL